MGDNIKQLLAKLRDGLAALYGERLKGVYLFGSHARDEGDEESDVDILIVLNGIENYSSEIAATSEMISELSLEYVLTLSRVFVSEKQWRHDQTLFLSNVREEAVPA